MLWMTERFEKRVTVRLNETDRHWWWFNHLTKQWESAEKTDVVAGSATAMIMIDHGGQYLHLASQAGYAQKILLVDMTTNGVLTTIDVSALGALSMSEGTRLSAFAQPPYLGPTTITAVVGCYGVFTANIIDEQDGDVDIIRHKAGQTRAFIPRRYQKGTATYDFDRYRAAQPNAPPLARLVINPDHTARMQLVQATGGSAEQTPALVDEQPSTSQANLDVTAQMPPDNSSDRMPSLLVSQLRAQRLASRPSSPHRDIQPGTNIDTIPHNSTFYQEAETTNTEMSIASSVLDRPVPDNRIQYVPTTHRGFFHINASGRRYIHFADSTCSRCREQWIEPGDE